MKKALAIGLLCAALGSAKPHPKLKRTAAKVHHALSVTGEAAIGAAILGVYIYSKSR